MKKDDLIHIAESVGIRRVEFFPGVIVYMATESEMLAFAGACAKHAEKPS